jgi:hypothetical protein
MEKIIDRNYSLFLNPEHTKSSQELAFDESSIFGFDVSKQRSLVINCSFIAGMSNIFLKNAPILKEKLGNPSYLIVQAAGNDGQSLQKSKKFSMIATQLSSHRFDAETKDLFLEGMDKFLNFEEMKENDLSNLILVSSIDPLTNQLAPTSNCPGESLMLQQMTVCAAGEKTVVLNNDGNYMRMDANGGTSYAAPIVSGVAALIQQAFPYFNAYQLKRCILESADRTFEGYDPKLHGQGIINAQDALEFAQTID